MTPLPTLAECLDFVSETPTKPTEQLQALDLWLRRREDVRISVGVLAAENKRQCFLHVHGRQFQAAARGDDYATTWTAIVATLRACEQFEAATFGGLG